jgi:DNA replication protein DnaC
MEARLMGSFAEKALQKLIDDQAMNIKIEEDDYFVDGLLYCGKCHTPKQCRLKVDDQIFTPMCLCKCAKEKVDAEKQEEKRKEHEQRVEELKLVGLPESRMRSWCFANDDGGNERLSRIARKYVQNFEQMRERGKGLLLYGAVGTGKSFMAACIANALIEQEHPCIMTTLFNLNNKLWDSTADCFSKISKSHLLIIDDFAAERKTEYMNEFVQNIIDQRYRSGEPMIITTNLTAEEIKFPADIKDQRLFSRLLEMCIPIEVKGNDRRKSQLKKDYRDLEEVLGL